MARSERSKNPHSAALSPYEEGTFKIVIALVPITFIGILLLLIFARI
jgi:hypothetical protein